MRFATLFTSSILLCAAPALAQEAPAIERLAPANSVVIVSVKNFKATMDRTKSTKLWELWQSEKIQTLAAEPLKDLKTGLKEMYKELGVEEGTLVPPSGGVGLAMFTMTDEESGMPAPAFLVIADYGAEADKTEALIQASLKRGQEKKELEYEEKDVLGRNVFSVTPTDTAAEAEAGAVIGEDDEFDDEMAMEGDPMEEAFKTMHFVREGGSFLLSTNLESLTGALEAIDGKGEAGVEDRVDFQGVREQLGEADVYAAVMFKGFGDVVAAADPMGMAMMMQPMIQEFIGDVQGLGLAIRMDAPTAMMEQTIGIYMPNGKTGLTALLDTQTPRGELPAFVGPDAITYGVLNFEFAGLPDLVAKFTNNPMFGQDPEAMAQVDAMLKQVVSTLGSKIHTVSQVSGPLHESSRQPILAIECTNPQGFETFFGQYAGMAMMEPRDFLGQRIYAMDPAMVPPEVDAVSLGVGGGYLIVGTTPGVEQALRATSEAGAATLDADSDFQRAVASLPKTDLVGWGFTNTVDAMESSVQQAEQTVAARIDDLRQFDPDAADELKEESQDVLKMLKDMDYDLLRQYIGPMSWQWRSTGSGFVIKSSLLSAE